MRKKFNAFAKRWIDNTSYADRPFKSPVIGIGLEVALPDTGINDFTYLTVGGDFVTESGNFIVV